MFKLRSVPIGGAKILCGCLAGIRVWCLAVFPRASAKGSF